ncbi:MAG TPA: PASTA domain-containing protein [Pyrinomonadaceae bacterium]|nr:PASTA domain-containing protein [Pyrinomonadaceae bacterium]
MSIVNTGISALGRLAALALLLGAFSVGLAGVVYMSLLGDEIPVPEITGKHLADGERELAAHGLKIRKRADRQSSEQPGTVIEQIPKAGETVKTGQWISVVVSKGGMEPDVPESLKKAGDEDDAEKIEEMISDKPKKAKANSNSSRKKADTGRDVNSNAATTNSNSKSSETDADKKESPSNNNSTDKNNKNPQTPAVKPTNPGTKPPAGDTKPKPATRP